MKMSQFTRNYSFWFFFLNYNRTDFHTNTNSLIRTHTHTRARAGTHCDQLLALVFFSFLDIMLRVSPADLFQSSLHSPPRCSIRASTNCLNMHTLFIYNYLQKKKAEFASATPGQNRDVVRQAVWKTRLSSVDPCQLFHDLNNLVHGGFTLHAAAVIDLKSSRTKQ